jgi:DNA-binding NtrC family response regulator
MKHIDVLIIDDEIKYTDMLSHRLSLRGITCQVRYDGRSGLQWIKENPGVADLVLLDLKLPDIYGTKVLARVKQIDADLPVFIITGHGTREDEEECLALGAAEFIHKPVSIEKITTFLHSVRREVQ